MRKYAEIYFPRPDDYRDARYYSVKIDVESQRPLNFDLDNVVKHALDALKRPGLIRDDRRASK